LRILRIEDDCKAHGRGQTKQLFANKTQLKEHVALSTNGWYGRELGEFKAGIYIPG
jgi:hypothetical protein